MEQAPEKIVEVMKTFDREFLMHIGNDRILDDETYGDYRNIISRLDELYSSLVWDRGEDEKEIKLEVIEALSRLENKYGFNPRPIQKMIL